MIISVQVDDHLLFSNHIDKIARKITSNTWLLSRIKDFLNKEHRVQFYKSFIQPHLDYCNIVWGNTSQNNLLRLFRLQKRACKIILDYNVDNIFDSMHAYQSLACETAINTDFSELFSLKRIYVKYKNAILSLIDCFFHT